LPPRIELLVIHDRDDRQLPADASERLVAAHGGRARLLVTDGYGHNRVLAAPETLDAVVAFVGAEGA
jgi:pimeloyl-ACP methyl ester carboxylesterase